MAAYVIAQINVKDMDAYKKYSSQTPATIGKYGGKPLARTDNPIPLEGSGTPRRVVMIEFPDMESAQNWYNSEEYQPLVPLRQAASEGMLMIVEGV